MSFSLVNIYSFSLRVFFFSIALSFLFFLLLLVMITLLVFWSWFLTFNVVVFLFDILSHDCLASFLVMVLHSFVVIFFLVHFGCDNLFGLLHWHTPKFLLKFKCKFEGENNERRSWDAFFNS
jgi:hypothetical protein